MSSAFHSQSNFLQGIRQTGPEVDQNYTTSLYDSVNYYITTGGVLTRRLGSSVLAEFNEPDNIKTIIPLGDGYVYLTETNNLKFLMRDSSPIKIGLFDFYKVTYDPTGDDEPVGVEAFRINRVNNDTIGEVDSNEVNPIAITKHGESVYVVGENQSRFLISIENGLIAVRPPYMDSVDRMQSFLRHHFYPLEYNRIPNPFFVGESIPYRPAEGDTRLVIGADADIPNGTCKAWIDINPDRTLDGNMMVDPDVVGLKDFIGKPIIFNVIPRNIPVLSTANDYSQDITYTNHPTLDSLNSQTAINDLTVLDNQSKIFALSGLLFQRKYMIIPKRIIGGGDSLRRSSDVYVNSETVSPSRTEALVGGGSLFDTPEPSEDDEEEDTLPKTTLVRGFNVSDSIQVSFERVLDPMASITGPLKIRGTFEPGTRGILIAVGFRVNNDIATDDHESTPFIILNRDSRLARNTVSATVDGPAYELILDGTSYMLNRASVVAGVGIEFTAQPIVREFGQPGVIFRDFSARMQLRYVNDQSNPSGPFVEWEREVTTPKSSNVYAECELIEIGIPSPYVDGDRRTIGGNDYDGAVTYGSNVLSSLREEFRDVTTTAGGVAIATKDKVYVQYDENEEASNNILGYLNSSATPDFQLVANTTAVSLTAPISPTSINAVLSSNIDTTYPEGYPFSLTYPFLRTLLSSYYTRFSLANEFLVLDNADDVVIEKMYTAFDDNLLLAQTRIGVYEIAFDKINATLRSREFIKDRLQLFLRKMVFLTQDNHVCLARLQVSSFGYETSTQGRLQKRLLDGATGLSYNLYDHSFLVSKENGEVVYFTVNDNTFNGFSRIRLMNDFKIGHIFESGSRFHLVGSFDDPSKKYIVRLKNQGDMPSYKDFEGHEKEQIIHSEIITNNLAFTGEAQYSGHLRRGEITKIRLFVKNFGQYKLGFSGEATPLTIVDPTTLANTAAPHQFNLPQQTFKDYLFRVHVIQDDNSSGGYLYGYQLEGDLAGD